MSDSVKQLTVMGELETQLTAEELRKAIDCLPAGKTTGLEDTPLKTIRGAKSILLHHLYKLL